MRRLAADYEGKLAELDADALLTCVTRNEKISQVAGRIMSYAGLRYYQLTTDSERAQFMSNCQEKLTNFTTPLVFFTLELNRLEDAKLDAAFAANADLARYKPVFDRIRAMKPYQLSDELEKFLHDLGVVGDAWERLFDETIAGLTFDIEGEDLNIEATLNYLTDHDRAKREMAARELARVFHENINLSRVHNTAAKEKRSSIAGAICQVPKPRATFPTMSNPKCRGAARCRGRRLSETLAPLLRTQTQMAWA